MKMIVQVHDWLLNGIEMAASHRDHSAAAAHTHTHTHSHSASIDNVLQSPSVFICGERKPKLHVGDNTFIRIRYYMCTNEVVLYLLYICYCRLPKLVAYSRSYLVISVQGGPKKKLKTPVRLDFFINFRNKMSIKILYIRIIIRCVT